VRVERHLLRGPGDLRRDLRRVISRVPLPSTFLRSRTRGPARGAPRSPAVRACPLVVHHADGQLGPGDERLREVLLARAAMAEAARCASATEPGGAAHARTARHGLRHRAPCRPRKPSSALPIVAWSPRGRWTDSATARPRRGQAFRPLLVEGLGRRVGARPGERDPRCSKSSGRCVLPAVPWSARKKVSARERGSSSASCSEGHEGAFAGSNSTSKERWWPRRAGGRPRGPRRRAPRTRPPPARAPRRRSGRRHRHLAFAGRAAEEDDEIAHTPGKIADEHRAPARVTMCALRR